MKIFTSIYSSGSNDIRGIKFYSKEKKQHVNSFFRFLFVVGFIVLTFSSLTGSAQLITNPITDANPSASNPFTTGQTVAANITASGIGRGTGITGNAGSNRYNATGWNTAFDANDYFVFTITPNTGYNINFTSLVYTGQASGTGPNTFAFRSSLDGYTANIGTPTASGTTISLTASSYQAVSSAVSFRLYGWGGTSAAGTFSVNDFTFNGTAQLNAAPPVINSSLTATATVGTAFTYTITATNSPTGFSSTTTFPVNGLTRSGAVISGVPTTATTPSTQNINIGASNGAGSDSKTLAITINKGNQIITGLAATNTKIYGSLPYNITGVTGGGSGNAVTFASSNPAVATISGNTVTITGAGSTTITGSQTGNINWNAAANVTQILTVNQATQTITFNALPDKNDNDADFALTATASSGLPVTYTSSNTDVAIITGDMVHIIAAGTTNIIASQPGNSNYAAATNVTQVQNILSTALLNQEIEFDPLQNKTYGDADFQLVAIGGGSGNPVTFVSSNLNVATISGDVATIIGPGTTTITASQPGNSFYNPAPDVIRELVIDVKSLTVNGAVANSKVYDGTTAATISNASLVGIVGSDLVAISSFAGTFADPNAANDITVTSGITLGGADAFKYLLIPPTGLAANISKANQSINFTSLPNKSVGDADFNLTATATSGLAVSYTNSNPLVATLTGNLVHIVALGSTTISASQPGDQNYNAASTVQQIQNVVPQPPVSLVTFDFTSLPGGTNNFGPSPLAPTSGNANVTNVGLTRGGGVGTTGSGAGKAWGGNTFTSTSQAAAIAANQFVSFSITANPGYSISLTGIPAYNIRRSATGATTGIWQYKVGAGSFTDIGTSITWGSVTNNLGNEQAGIDLSTIPALQNVTSANAITFRLVTWGASSATGTWYFNEPGTSTRILGVNGNVNEIPALPPVVTGADLTGTVTSLFSTYTVIASNGPVFSYAIASGSLPPGLSFNTVNGQITGTPTAAGSYTIGVTATNGAGTSVTPGTVNFSISKGDQIITGLSLTDTKIYGDAPYSINGVTGGASGNSVSFASSDPAVAIISGNTVTITGAGTTTITASQPGNNDWNDAPNVTQTLTVSQSAQAITFASLPDRNDNEADFSLTATASSGLPVTYVSSNTSVATIVSGNMVHIIAAGTTTITASQTGNTNYTAAPDVSQVQNILNTTLLNQSITFDPLSNKIYGDATFQLNGSASSGLTLSYQSSNTTVATISGDLVTIIGPGTTIITASQGGNGAYNPAPDAAQNFTVDVKPLTVTGVTASDKVYDGTTLASLSGGSLVGIEGSDIVSITGYTGTFVDPNVANGIPVTAGLTLGGLDAIKYSLVQPAGLSANITKADQTIIFTALPDKFFGDADFNLTATSNSGLPVSYTSSNTSVANITGSLVHLLSIGSTTITATQAGDQNYNAAASTEQIQNVLQPSPVALVTFDFTSLVGGANIFGASPLTPTSIDANVLADGLTRGSGIGTTGTGASKAWGGTNFSTSITNQSDAVTGNQFVTFYITAKPGNDVSLSAIPAYNIRRSASGPATGIWQYRVGTGSFTDIGSAITWGTVTTAAGNDQAAIDLSTITELQHVGSSNTIALRVVLWGAAATAGTWYFNEPATGTRILTVKGNALPALPEATFTGLPATICASAPAIVLTGTPSNGTFSGSGIINGNTFDPSIAGPGTHTITYAVAGYSSSIQQVLVDQLTVTFTGLAATYCTTDAQVTLMSNQSSGTFTGPGVTDNGNGTASFNPATAGAGGPYTITFTYSNGTCSNSVSQTTSVSVCATFATVNLKVYLEGFMNGSTMKTTLFDLGLNEDPTATDNITVNLWSVASLSNPIPDYTLTALLHSDGTATMQFPAAVVGGSFYIAVKHRNSMETWSKLPVTFGATTPYDFSTGLTQAYDDGINPPMANMGSGVFAFYGGEVNQDGTVDGTDANAVEIDTDALAFGYNPTDANGDGATDGQDANIVENNTGLLLFFARPY